MTRIYVMTLLFCVCETQSAAITTDLMLLLDSSNSISIEEFRDITENLVSSSSSFDPSICSCLQVGILQYGQLDGRNLTYLSSSRRHYTSPTDLGDCKTISCFNNAVKSMKHLKAANTYTARAIERVVKFNFHQSSLAHSAKKILILITDGAATDYKLLDESFTLTQSNNVTVYAIGVGSKVNLGQLRMSANGGISDERVATAGNFAQLASILKNIYTDVVPVCRTDIPCEQVTTMQMTTDSIFTTSDLSTTSIQSTATNQLPTTINLLSTMQSTVSNQSPTTIRLSTTSRPIPTKDNTSSGVMFENPNTEPAVKASTVSEPETTYNPTLTDISETTSESSQSRINSVLFSLCVFVALSLLLSESF